MSGRIILAPFWYNPHTNKFLESFYGINWDHYIDIVFIGYIERI